MLVDLDTAFQRWKSVCFYTFLAPAFATFGLLILSQLGVLNLSGTIADISWYSEHILHRSTLPYPADTSTTTLLELGMYCNRVSLIYVTKTTQRLSA